jgi:hypothetical protein
MVKMKLDTLLLTLAQHHSTGIKKLQITLVIEDEKVSLDELQEKISEFEDYVQSSDVAAMQSMLSPSAAVIISLKSLQNSKRHQRRMPGGLFDESRL